MPLVALAPPAACCLAAAAAAFFRRNSSSCGAANDDVDFQTESMQATLQLADTAHSCKLRNAPAPPFSCQHRELLAFLRPYWQIRKPRGANAALCTSVVQRCSRTIKPEQLISTHAASHARLHTSDTFESNAQSAVQACTPCQGVPQRRQLSDHTHRIRILSLRRLTKSQYLQPSRSA